MTATPAGMTYADYLDLDRLLSAQKPLSGLHDEMLFIVIHQTKELWLKQMLHELDLAIELTGQDHFAGAYKAMSRIGRIQSVMTLSWDVLSTLTPVDYSAFREVLGTSSGFQSVQFREVEYKLGIRDPRFLEHYAEGSDGRARLQAALDATSLRGASHAALERAGFDLGDRSEHALGDAWLAVYRDSERWFDLYQLAEKLVDLDDALAMWRHKHVLTVERIIGNKPGTGGSAGAAYLRSTLDKRAFPELWSPEDQSLSFKPLFARSLAADPERLHLAAHSHHLWPDASFEGQVECWLDAARLADRKWDKVMGEVWPEAQGHVAAELGTGMADAVVFASSTHDFLVRLAAAAPRADPRRLRLLCSDGEFHSARRQFARWAEDGWLELETVAAEPFDDFTPRFLAAAQRGGHDLILVSQVLFGSGRRFDGVAELAALGRPGGPWVVVDGYHAFMALPARLREGKSAQRREGRGLSPAGPANGASLFYLGGGYKYAMAGEGSAFLHAPPGFGPRPPVTGWFAEFEDLTLPPGSVGYSGDAMRFMGATFDPSALYRFNAVQRMLAGNGLTTAGISAHVEQLQSHLVEAIRGTALGQAELLNPLDGRPHARFLAFRSPNAMRWHGELQARTCITDVRGDVLRIGLGLYHDESDVDAFAALMGTLR